MKKGINLVLLSLAMGVVATGGANSSNNSRTSMAKAETIIDNKIEEELNIDAPCAQTINGLARIKSMDATYTGMESFGPETSFSTENYFANLKDYSPNNNIGSCGFVSLSQLLSYYDTFLNDSIVPERYERKLETATTEDEVKTQSPGMVKGFYNKNNGSYYDYCHTNEDSDLDCALTIAYNKAFGTDNEDNFKYSIGGWSYQQMLNQFYGDSSFATFMYVRDQSQEYFKQYIKECIDDGNPVIVHLNNNPGTFGGGHSVVAYAYEGDNIYAHYGWGDYSAKVNLFYSYNNIYLVGKLGFKGGHSCSNNYIINGKGYCGCNITNEYYAKTTFDGKHIIYWANDGKSNGGTIRLNVSLIRRPIDLTPITISDKYELNIKEYEDLRVIPEPNKEELFISDKLIDLDENKDKYAFEITDEDEIKAYLDKEGLEFIQDSISIDEIINLNTTNIMYVLRSRSNAVEVNDEVYNYIFRNNRTSTRSSFKRNSDINYAGKGRLLYKSEFENRDVTLTVNDYNFGNTYTTSATTKTITKDCISIVTNRLRCGSIYDSSITHNTYTTISAKRSGFGTAYIEYTMPVAVKSIEINLAMWSASEGLSATTGTAEISYKDSDGDWILATNLLSDVKLSTDKDNMTKVKVTFVDETTTFRVYSTVKSATGSANKARICIGDLKIVY